MEWIIVTDSGCDLLPGELAPNVHLRRVPLSILLGEEEWVDGADMDRERFLTAMEAYKGKSSSACPSPETWARAFSEGDHVIAITITGGLSGSYNSALLGRDLLWEKQPHKPVYVLDSRSAGAEIALLVFRACELIARGLSFEQVTQQLWLYHQHTHLLFLLEHVDNFVKNGRLNKLVAATIGMLGVRILGCASEHGTLQPLMKPRGAARGLDLLVRELERAGYAGGQLAITHVQNEEGAARLASLIREVWPGAPCLLLPASGLCSYYGEKHGLIVGFEDGQAKS